MRLALVIVVLAGCHARDHGPTWPTRADRGTDGGESLAPHQARSVTVAADDDEAIVDAKPTAEKPSAPTATVDAPKAPTTTPTTEDSLFGEDITIEVDD